MPTTRTAILVASTFTLACHKDQGDTTWDDQLEAPTFEPSGPGIDDPYMGADLSGTFTVTGAERDFSFATTTAEGDFTVEAHTPGQADLSTLDGEHLDIHIPVEEDYSMGGDELVTITDDTGLVYVAAMPGSYPRSADPYFGAGFVDFGEAIGEALDEYEEHTVIFYAAEVQTDEGAVQVLPGEVTMIKVRGETWRFTLLAAYAEKEGGLLSRAKCIPAPDVLSYELLRVLDDEDDGTLIMRPDTLGPVAVSGC